MASMLLSASVKRVDVSRMRDFFLQNPYISYYFSQRKPVKVKIIITSEFRASHERWKLPKLILETWYVDMLLICWWKFTEEWLQYIPP